MTFEKKAEKRHGSLPLPQFLCYTVPAVTDRIRRGFNRFFHNPPKLLPLPAESKIKKETVTILWKA